MEILSEKESKKIIAQYPGFFQNTELGKGILKVKINESIVINHKEWLIKTPISSTYINIWLKKINNPARFKMKTLEKNKRIAFFRIK